MVKLGQGYVTAKVTESGTPPVGSSCEQLQGSKQRSNRGRTGQGTEQRRVKYMTLIITRIQAYMIVLVAHVDYALAL